MIIIKTEEQIEGIRKSCQLAADTLDHIEHFVKEGATTEDINREAEKYIRDYGAIPAPLGYKGFPKAICTSLNEVVCHGIPSDKVILKEGDILNVDVTTILNGYYGDTCRMFPVGKVSEEAERLMAVTRDCLHIGIARVKPNAQFWEISKAIQDYADARGYGVVSRFAGHGLGLKFHEEPQIAHNYNPQYRDNRRMQPGMIFTIEPMICTKSPDVLILEDGWTAVTADGGLSSQYEHSLLVTSTGVEVLTK
jgi:methionyl aminopeptidase